MSDEIELQETSGQPLLKENDGSSGVASWCPTWLKWPFQHVAIENDSSTEDDIDDTRMEERDPPQHHQLAQHVVCALLVGLLTGNFLYKTYLFLPGLFVPNMMLGDAYLLEMGLAAITTTLLCKGLQPLVLPAALEYRVEAVQQLSGAPAVSRDPCGIIAAVCGAVCMGIGMAFSRGVPELHIVQLGTRFRWGVASLMGCVLATVIFELLSMIKGFRRLLRRYAIKNSPFCDITTGFPYPLIVLAAGFSVLIILRIFNIVEWTAHGSLPPELSRVRAWAWDPMRVGVCLTALHLGLRWFTHSEADGALALSSIRVLPSFLLLGARQLYRRARNSNRTRESGDHSGSGEKKPDAELEAGLMDHHHDEEQSITMEADKNAETHDTDDRTLRKQGAQLLPLVVTLGLLVACLLLGVSKGLNTFREKEPRVKALKDLLQYLIPMGGSALHTFGARVASGGFFYHLVAGSTDLRWVSLLIAPLTLTACFITLLCPVCF